MPSQWVRRSFICWAVVRELDQLNNESALGPQVMGRTFLDFLNCLDDLHDYLKFSYNKLKSPMFAVVAESRWGVTLQYRTKRKGLGLEFYIMGILRELASRLYATDLRVSIVTQTEDECMPRCVELCLLLTLSLRSIDQFN